MSRQRPRSREPDCPRRSNPPGIPGKTCFGCDPSLQQDASSTPPRDSTKESQHRSALSHNHGRKPPSPPALARDWKQRESLLPWLAYPATGPSRFRLSTPQSLLLRDDGPLKAAVPPRESRPWRFPRKAFAVNLKKNKEIEVFGNHPLWRGSSSC